jgi:glutathionylspermidine synthase
MRRHRITPRPDWQQRAHTLGFTFASIDGEPYWDESAAWEFSASEIETLWSATTEISRLYRIAMDHAVTHDERTLLGITAPAWRLVVASWRRQDASLYGRFDLRWDGVSPPKLLEYNADTPTSLYEAAVVQWDWLLQAQPGADQFNSLHEALIARWREFRASHSTIHFTCMRDPVEDRGTTDYLRDTALQADIAAPWIAIEDIGWDGRNFRDLRRENMRAIFKLYPWDWLLGDEFGAHIENASAHWIEPAWKLAAASKVGAPVTKQAIGTPALC